MAKSHSTNPSRRAFLAGAGAVVGAAQIYAQPSGGDDSASIQSAIETIRSAGGGTLRCRPGAVYHFASPIRFDDCWRFTVEGNHSTWNYTGHAADAITLKSAVLGTFRELRLTYSDPAFGGHLVSTDWSARALDASHLSFRDVEFSGPANGNARALLRLNRAIFTAVDHCQFMGGHIGILGCDGAYSNITRIVSSAFYSLRFAGIYNAGEGWTIDSNGFEPLTSGQACAYTQDMSTVAKGFAYTRNWHGDITQPGGSWVSVRASGLSLDANYFGSPGGPADPCLRLFAVQGGQITANHNQTTACFADFRPEAGVSRNVTLMSNDLGIGAVLNRQYCVGLRMINNFGQPDL